LFGLKPSRGRNPVGPPVSEGWGGLVAEHVVTRSVRDSAVLLDATHGTYAGSQYTAPAPQSSFFAASQRDPGRLRIAYTTASFIGSQVQVHGDCVTALNQTVRLLADLGHDVVEDAPPVNAAELAIAFVTGLAASVSLDLDYTASICGRKVGAADFEPATWALGQLGKSITAAAYLGALGVFQVTTNAVGAWFAKNRYDALLTPTLATPPARIGSLKPTQAEVKQLLMATSPLMRKLVPPMKVIEPLALKIFGFIPHTPLFNVTGQPAMSVPLHWNASGLPIGVQFAGRYGDEETLFALAGQLERAQPWGHRMPELE
jgi:amidase